MRGPDSCLLPLVNRNTCVLASDIPNLHLEKESQLPDVRNLQVLYARLPYAPLSLPYPDADTFTWPVAGMAPSEMGPTPVYVRMEITQAPATFAVPGMQKKAWETPFQVEMTWQSCTPVRFRARVRPYALGDDAMSSPESWTPPSAAAAVSFSLDGAAAIERDVLLTPKPGETGVYVHVAVFSFPKLAFGGPSNMRPRWMAFAGSLLGPEGFVLAILKVPTVVMSRSNEQKVKAQNILWGSVPPLTQSDLDYSKFRDHITSLMLPLGITRQLSPEDFAFLEYRAGFMMDSRKEGVMHRRPSSGEFDAFKSWLNGHLDIIHHCRSHFNSMDPLVIAGFDCDRTRSRDLIAKQLPGSFLLRLGSRGGELVMTLKSFEGDVDHIRLSRFRMQTEGLQNTVQAYPNALQLLDTRTGILHSLGALQWDYINQDNGATLGVKRSKERCSSPPEISSRGLLQSESTAPQPASSPFSTCPTNPMPSSLSDEGLMGGGLLSQPTVGDALSPGGPAEVNGLDMPSFYAPNLPTGYHLPPGLDYLHLEGPNSPHHDWT